MRDRTVCWQKIRAAPKINRLQRWGCRTSTWGITGGTFHHEFQDYSAVRRGGAGLHFAQPVADGQGLCPLFRLPRRAPRARTSRHAIFLFGGLKSHGPGAHDYPYFLDSWSKLLTSHGAVVDGAFSFPSQEQLDKSGVVIIYKGDAGYMTPEQRARLQAYVKRGGGLVTFHDSLCGPDPADMATLVGAGKKHGEVNYTWTATLDYNVVDKAGVDRRGTSELRAGSSPSSPSPARCAGGAARRRRWLNHSADVDL
jgi:hypothetical protein